MAWDMRKQWAFVKWMKDTGANKTKKDCWQENRLLKDYAKDIPYGTVVIKNGLMEVTI